MSSELQTFPETYDLYIDGTSVAAQDGDRLTTYDPATERPLSDVASATAIDVDNAVDAARRAFDSWHRMPPAERGRLLTALAERIREERSRLAHVETFDNGKPLSQAKADVEACARYIEYYAGFADKVNGDTIAKSEDYLGYTVREPLGVTAQIIPWNFPIAIFGRSVAPALATGNVAIVKPAEQTPLSALELGALATDVGFPDGVLNVIPGFGAEAGAPLAGHPGIDGVSFTGSVVTGRTVAKLAVDNVTPVHLELGGKSPAVVFPDADLTNAIENVVWGIFTKNSGQVCSACSRLLVHESIHEEMIHGLITEVESLKMGPGIDEPDMGPLVSQEQYEKVHKYLEIGREEAGEPVIGGGVPEREGYFVEPTIFDDVPNESRLAQEEIFGPVLSVIEFSDEAEAIRLANDIEYGLVAGIFTSDHGRAHRFARDIQAGCIFINEWSADGVETPFGGYKDSGFGREKGPAAIDAFTQLKSVCARIER